MLGLGDFHQQTLIYKIYRFAVKKDGGVFDQFAGATITPRGVVKAVKGGLVFFEKERSNLLDEAGGKS